MVLTKREEELEKAIWNLPNMECCINFEHRGYDTFVRRSDVTELFRKIRLEDRKELI